MAEGKWISDLTATTPLVDAARRVLSIRFAVIRNYLGLALRESDKDLENVHQLRVSTRRAAAAVDIFAPCLPAKVYNSAHKQLRRLRRAAGEARDWDVFLATLAEEKAKHKRHHRAGLDFLTGYALGRRVSAQAGLEEAGSHYPFAFERLQTQTLAAIHKPHYKAHTRTLRDLGGPLLLGLFRDFDRASSADLSDYAHLHRVRVLGKQLRYAMEVFADCFAPAFRDKLYPAVEEMQDILGRANDSYVASQRLAAIRDRIKVLVPDDWKRLRAGIESLLKHHDRRLPEERECFLEWLKRWQASGGEKAFSNLLNSAEPAAS